MTKGEAVDYIKEWLKDEYALNSKDRIVLTMAIEALSNADQRTQRVESVDTISRRDAILAITGEPPEAHYPSWYAERIKALPSAPDSRQRGEWREDNKGYFYCNQCHKYPKYQEAKSGFCPSCGARMYKGGDSE